MKTLDDIFLEARELSDPAKRAAYLAEACGGDAAMLAKVEGMLRDAEGAGRFFAEEATTVGGGGGGVADTPPDRIRYFGDYELLGEIARGGMGVVYRARQCSLNRVVAVKMILSGDFATEADVKRFRLEAEAAANLQHPNIVAIHEVGEQEGRQYFSMDFVEGRNLAQVIKAEMFTPQAAAALLKTIAEAVHYAHQRGTLHRDLKPQNVLIDGSGSPRITDFGLAKKIEQGGGLTRTGAVMGSPSYMPPEQARGRGEATPASDVYSLGAILYQMLTGRPPFEGDSPVEILRQVLEREPVPPTKLNGKIPKDLETICLKCLEKQPERRYHSARALAEELGRLLNFEPILARPASRLRRWWGWTQRNPWVFAAGCGLLALGLGCLAYGLWERSLFLSWRLEAGKATFRPPKESPAVLFLGIFPAMCFLLYFADNAFQKLYRRRAQSLSPAGNWQLLAHGALGLVWGLAGMGYLLAQIRAWVWLGWSWPMLGLELTGVLCAMALNCIGFRSMWKAVGMHETSRFRELVDRALEQQIAREGGRWSLRKLLVFSFWLIFAAQGFVVLALLTAGAGKGVGGPHGIAGLLVAAGTGALAWRGARGGLSLSKTVYPPMLAGLCGLLLAAFLSASATVFAVAGGTAYTSLLLLAGAPFYRPANATPRRNRFLAATIWRSAFCGLLSVAVVSAAGYRIEGWRGKRQWARVKAELEAKGESLELSAFSNPPVPDSENVMAHPYMRRYFVRGGFDFPPPRPPMLGGERYPYALAALRRLPREGAEVLGGSLRDILDWYAENKQDFAQLEQALDRPHSMLQGAASRPAEWPMPNFASFRVATLHYSTLCKVHLLAGEGEAALNDLRLMRRLSEAVGANSPPPMEETMMRVAIAGMAARTMEETMAAGLWSPNWLGRAQEQFKGVSLAQDTILSLRGDRARVLQMTLSGAEEGGFLAGLGFHVSSGLRLVLALMPAGWWELNRANYALAIQDEIQASAAWSGPTNGRAAEGGTELQRILARIAFPAFQNARLATAKNQSAVDMAYLACGLERYRAAKGSYPQKLEELVPEFAAKVPLDITNGQPLRYRARAAGGYSLYSMGYTDARDEDGNLLPTAGGGNSQARTDDWVWRGAPEGKGR